MHDLPILKDLVLLFGLAVVVVALVSRIGIPTIAGFILAGIVIGPKALGVVEDSHEVELLSEIGVALLLFGIGIELELPRLRRLWRPVAVGGFLQMSFTGGAATVLGLLAGFETGEAIFLGFLCGVSSTAIVLRGLESRGEIDAPHGRLTLGILIFQDLAVVPMMLLVPVLGGGAGTGFDVAWALLRAVGVLVAVVALAWIAVPRVLDVVARTRQRDLFVLTVFLVSLGTAWVATRAGVSLALGAFLAGLVVASSHYRHQVLAELIPFREILTSLFFVSVGMLFDPDVLRAAPLAVGGIFAALVLGKFLLVAITAAVMRLPLRVCILSGVALAQVGEFSFVLLHAAPEGGLLPAHVEERLVAAVILSMLITPLAFAVGPRLAAGAGRIQVLTRLLGVASADDLPDEQRVLENHVIIAGYGMTGEELAAALSACGVAHVVVDLNPENVRKAAEDGVPAYYGDVTSAEVLDHLGLSRAREVVIVINDPAAARRAITAIRERSPGVRILVRARYLADAHPLLVAGADEVVPAELEAAVEVASRVLHRYGVEDPRVESVVERLRSHHPEVRGQG